MYRAWKRVRGVGLVLAVLLLLIAAANQIFIEYVRRQLVLEREMAFLEEVAVPRSSFPETDSSFAELVSPEPFREVDAFDAEADNWSNTFSLVGGGGVTVFDANGDDRLDVYLCHDGQNWTRATDEKGVLGPAPRHQCNGLYLNQGNDAEGRPIFRAVGALVHPNGSYSSEELLVEDYLFPRHSPNDSVERWGRSSNVAVAADFNNDGRMDLLVGNEPKGILWSHPETQRVLHPIVDPLGRQAKRSTLPLVSLANSFIKYQPRQGMNEHRKSARGHEPEGANSLYLNLGDRDGDGIPEWKDASRESGIEGTRATYGLAVADIDLDGDLDVYVANTQDMDYWIGGSTKWAGGANELFVNQLAETGKLEFRERAGEMNVDGLFDDDYSMPALYRLKTMPFMPIEYSFAFFQPEEYRPAPLVIDGEAADLAEISWATVFQDVDLDGYPDLWVANDVGYLRLYMNQRGARFESKPHARSGRTGNWMSFAPGDFEGDLDEDLIVGNLGGGIMSNAFLTFDLHRMLRPTAMDALLLQFMIGKHDWAHACIDGSDPLDELPHRVRHSAVLPPDASLPHNVRGHAPTGYEMAPFDPHTLDSLEFAWGMAALDVQNDGRLDLYYTGSMFFRGGGIFPISGTGPGRLLVNATRKDGPLRLVDQTAEHHVFNIEELQYDKLATEGYIYRRSPAQNWSKRDVVRSTDRSSWLAQGPSTQEHVTNQDLIQTAEQGRGVVAADLNGDGFSDLLLTNKGGYDSRRSTAVNLKVMIDGQPRVVPPPDNYYPALTNFDPGRTRLFVNGHRDGHWLRVRLVDDDPRTFNRNAVGARAILNRRFLRVQRNGSGGYVSNFSGPLHFGVGDGVATELEVHWPDRDRTVTHIELGGYANGTVIVSKQTGLVKWIPGPVTTADAGDASHTQELTLGERE